MFRYHFEPDQRILEITFQQDLHGIQVDTIREDVFKLIQCPEIKSCCWEMLIINLNKVEAVDSMGMNFLISLVHTAKRSAAQVRVKIARLNIYQVFQFIRMDEIAEIEFEEAKVAFDPGL